MVRCQFIPKDLEVEIVRKFRFLHFPNWKRISLSREAALDKFGSVLEHVELHKSAGVQVDHQRPSRSVFTVSWPDRPFTRVALAR